MTLSGVKCTVDTCHFWAAGNRCEAEKIEVDVDHATIAARGMETAGRAGGGMEIGEMGGRRGAAEAGAAVYEAVGRGGRGNRAEARQSEHTCCRTFRPRG